MNRQPHYKLLGFSLILFLHSTTGLAQSTEKKIYRWIDNDGKVQISDQLPPDAVDKARQEYNVKTGTLRSSVFPQLSPEEQAKAAMQEQAQAAALAQAEMTKRIEQGMLINYQTEEELQRTFDEKTDLLKQTIVSLKANIQTRRAIMISTLNELSTRELNGKQIPAEKTFWIKNNHAQLIKQTEQLARLNTSFSSIHDEFKLTLEKYRALKAQMQQPRSTAP